MTPKPWSYSALDSHATCPKKHYEIKIAKRFPDPPGEAAMWGDRVHVAFENYLKARTPLDVELSMYQGYLDRILQTRGTMYVEAEMCLDRKLLPCAPFDPAVFVRGYVDVLHVDNDWAYAMDHKTGKRKAGSKQMKLMALLTFAHHPQVQHIKVGFFWLKTAERDIHTYHRSDIAALWDEFVPELTQYVQSFHTGVWQARPSGLCHGWCPVTDCEFWKPRKFNRR